MENFCTSASRYHIWRVGDNNIRKYFHHDKMSMKWEKEEWPKVELAGFAGAIYSRQGAEMRCSTTR